MDSILELLQSTEALLMNARENIQKIKSLDVDKKVGAKLLPLIEKYDEAEENLDNQKEKLLRIIIRLSLSFGRRTYCFGNDGSWLIYEISSPELISVSRTFFSSPHPLIGKNSLSEFISKSRYNFYFFQLCKEIIEVSGPGLEKTPARHRKEIQLIAGLISELTELTKKTEAVSI